MKRFATSLTGLILLTVLAAEGGMVLFTFSGSVLGEELRFSGQNTSPGGHIDVRLRGGGPGSFFDVESMLDITVNDSDLTVLYNEYRIETDTLLWSWTRSYFPAGVIPVSITTTIEINPLVVQFTDVGPLPLVQVEPMSPEFRVGESLTNRFSALPVSGTYWIEGPNDMFSGSFNFSRAPDDESFVDSFLFLDYPNSVTSLGHDYSNDRNLSYDSTTVLFTGIVDDVDCTLEVRSIQFWCKDIVLTPLPGDANQDGTVDENDATILAEHWLMASGATRRMGDFNGDGAVDDIDATMMAANWGAGTSVSVPEPTTITLLLCGLVVFVMLPSSAIVLYNSKQSFSGINGYN